MVWDDRRTHLDANATLMKGDVTDFWTSPYAGLYIPVSYTVWTAVKQITGVDSEGKTLAGSFHVLNILLHLLNILLVFILIRRLFGDSPAYITAVVFALHPVQVESVAWISEMRGLLSATFGFVFLLLYFGYRKTKKKEWLWLAILAFAFCLLSKPQYILLPLLAMCIDRFFFDFKWKNSVKTTIPILLIALPIIFITKIQQPDSSVENLSPLIERPLVATDALGHYLYKAILPIDLTASYGRTPESISGSSMAINIVLAVMLIIGGWFFYKRFPRWFIGPFWILLCLIPVLGLIPFEFQKFSTVADRFFYMAMAGFGLMIAMAIQRLNKVNFNWIIGTGLALVLAGISWSQLDIWKNELSLWKHSAEVQPGQFHVYKNLGTAYFDVPNMKNALTEFNKALAINSNDAPLHTNLGNTYAASQNPNKAFEHYQKAISIDEEYYNAWFGIGNLYGMNRDWNNALIALNRTVFYAPEFGPAYASRCTVNYQLGFRDEAIADARMALQLNARIDPALLQVLGL